MKCFRCSHSGLLLPPDYKENWGIFYGHGLGPEPVSECLDSNMRVKHDLTRANYTGDPREFMFPFHVTHAKIELVDVPKAEYEKPENRMILAIDDPSFARRCAILRDKQKDKPEMTQLKIAMAGKTAIERQSWR